MNADELYRAELELRASPPPAPRINPADALGDASMLGAPPPASTSVAPAGPDPMAPTPGGQKPFDPADALGGTSMLGAGDEISGSEFLDPAKTVAKTIWDIPGALSSGVFLGAGEAVHAAGLIDKDQIKDFRAFIGRARSRSIEGGVNPTASALVESVGQILPAALPVFKGLRLIGLARPAAMLIAEAVGGALGFNPDEPNLANLARDNIDIDQGELLDVVTKIMATNPDDSDALNRIRNGVQDLVIGGSFELLFKGVSKAVARIKEGKAPFPVGMSIEDVSGDGAALAKEPAPEVHRVAKEAKKYLDDTWGASEEPNSMVSSFDQWPFFTKLDLSTNREGGHSAYLSGPFGEIRISDHSGNPNFITSNANMVNPSLVDVKSMIDRAMDARNKGILEGNALLDEWEAPRRALSKKSGEGWEDDFLDVRKATSKENYQARKAVFLEKHGMNDNEFKALLKSRPNRVYEKQYQRRGEVTPSIPGIDSDGTRSIQPAQHAIPAEADNPNSIVNMLYNAGDPPPPPDGRRWTKAQLAVKLEADAKASGRYVDEYNEASRESISGTIVNEVAAALKREGNSSGWYNSKLIEMNEQLRVLHPELVDGSVDEGVFKLGLALTSNGTVVGENLKFAEHVYSIFKDTRRFPDNLASMEAALGGFGKEGPILVKSFQKANRLIDEMGADDFVEFLNTPITVRELKQLGFAVSRENMDMMTHGSAIFGPKIGAGFYQNLRGNFDPVTFDRWWTASWGRWTGRSPERVTAKAQGDQLDRFRVATGKKYTNRKAAITAAKKIYAKYKKNNFQPRTEENRAAQRLAEGSETKMREDPGAGGERAFMRETVYRAVEKLKELGHNITPADLQATVWYPEKELHGRLGIGSGRSAPDDYAAAARRLVEERNAGQ